MQTVYNTTNTTATALTRTNVDKYLETAGFVPEPTRQVIYYILERPYLCADLGQFAPHEATREAYPCYILYWEKRKIKEYLESAVPSIKYSLTDPIIHGYVRDAARHLFEMITASNK